MAEINEEQWKVLLKSTKFFEIFEDQEINKIVSFSDLLHFPMHKYIIKENEKDLSFYVVVKGHANVISRSQLLGDRKLLTIHAGECFGEMAVITHEPRKNDIIAGNDCYVAKINAATIDSFDESMQLKLYKQFSVNLIKRLLLSGMPEK
tara:strand:- start:9724 stop:10170 length:447 start_codon:yes stop_codon:yes gene_type:complete